MIKHKQTFKGVCMNYSLAKYNGKWSVYCKQSRCYEFIGCGKAFCQRKVNELNLGL